MMTDHLQRPNKMQQPSDSTNGNQEKKQSNVYRALSGKKSVIQKFFVKVKERQSETGKTTQTVLLLTHFFQKL